MALASGDSFAPIIDVEPALNEKQAPGNIIYFEAGPARWSRDKKSLQCKTLGLQRSRKYQMSTSPTGCTALIVRARGVGDWFRLNDNSAKSKTAVAASRLCFVGKSGPHAYAWGYVLSRLRRYLSREAAAAFSPQRELGEKRKENVKAAKRRQQAI